MDQKDLDKLWEDEKNWGGGFVRLVLLQGGPAPVGSQKNQKHGHYRKSWAPEGRSHAGDAFPDADDHSCRDAGRRHFHVFVEIFHELSDPLSLPP
jgi:hypothetical protein